jgi:hypothetical protein
MGMISDIQILTVNYNTPDLLKRLIYSFRKFYDNKIIIIDGSDKENYENIKNLSELDCTIHHFSYNIHHGPGMGYGFGVVSSDKIMVLDSDVEILQKGFIEDLEKNLPEWSYGIGDCQFVDEKGCNIGLRKGAIGLQESEMTEGGYRYLHPACMLLNKNIIMQWPLPVKHGAPMIETMKVINKLGKSNILTHSNWVHNDFRNEEKIYIKHDWMGTVNITGGYHI